MFSHMINSDGGEMDGACASFRCSSPSNKVQPRATYYNRTKNSWICFQCAQKSNAEALQMHRKFDKDLSTFKRPCITSQERVMELLSQRMD
jgi:hypothetical protein